MKNKANLPNLCFRSEEDGVKEGANLLEVQWRFIQTLVLELNQTKAQHRRALSDLHQARSENQVLRATLDAYQENGLQPGAIAGGAGG